MCLSLAPVALLLSGRLSLSRTSASLPLATAEWLHPLACGGDEWPRFRCRLPPLDPGGRPAGGEHSKGRVGAAQRLSYMPTFPVHLPCSIGRYAPGLGAEEQKGRCSRAFKGRSARQRGACSIRQSHRSGAAFQSSPPILPWLRHWQFRLVAVLSRSSRLFIPPASWGRFDDANHFLATTGTSDECIFADASHQGIGGGLASLS